MPISADTSFKASTLQKVNSKLNLPEKTFNTYESQTKFPTTSTELPLLQKPKFNSKAPLPNGRRGNSSNRGAGLRHIGSMITQNKSGAIYQQAAAEASLIQIQKNKTDIC